MTRFDLLYETFSWAFRPHVETPFRIVRTDCHDDDGGDDVAAAVDYDDDLKISCPWALIASGEVVVVGEEDETIGVVGCSVETTFCETPFYAIVKVDCPRIVSALPRAAAILSPHPSSRTPLG